MPNEPHLPAPDAATATAERVLVLTGPGRGTDGPAVSAFAASDLPVEPVADLAALAHEAERGGAVAFVLLPAVADDDLDRLERELAGRGALGAMAVHLLDARAAAVPEETLARLAAIPHVTVADAVPPPQHLVATARGALRERQRQAYVHGLLGRIEEAERREERLVATLGHELRNPLGVITTALSVMERIEGDEGPTVRHRRMIERQVEALIERIDELLAGEFEPEQLRAREWPPPRPGRGTAEGAAEPAPPSGPGVLVIEDDDDGRAALAELLGLWGYRVETARDGESGVEKAIEHHPSVALIDIGLPGIDGYEVARRLKAELNGSTPRLIAMTGYGQPEDRQRAMQAGFERHLVKPVDAGRLAELLADDARTVVA